MKTKNYIYLLLIPIFFCACAPSKFIKEDGYEEAIDQLFEDMETYLAEESAAAASKKAEEKNQSKGSKKESSDSEESVYVQTEDIILDILESGGDIETINNKKRFNAF